jgi:hypothetical protein
MSSGSSSAATKRPIRSPPSFAGGAAELWSRVCDEDWRADLVLTHPGLVGRRVRALTCRLRPNGRLAKLHREAGGTPPACPEPFSSGPSAKSAA